MGKYVLIDENNYIINIIDCLNDETANKLNAFPYYNGAEISTIYNHEFLNVNKNKENLIIQSKINLANYLETHPLLWTDGEYYSITEEKQNQLTSTLVAAQVDGKKPEWNSTGLVCKEWELEDLAALGVAIKNRVKKLVKYQQEKELEIKSASTQEELDLIVIDYNTVE